MVYRGVFCLIILCFVSNIAWAQAPVSDFTVQSTACLQERVKISNLSSNATSYEWDFCLGDITSVKSSSNHASIANLNFGANLKLLFDQGKWYGFVLSENNSRLIRLDFGNDLANVPIVVDLGNPDGQLSFPEGLDIIKAGANWFGFVGHLDLGRGVVRLNFGNSLENIPTAINVSDFGYSVRFRDLKIVNQGGDYILVLSNYNDNSLVRVNFGTDITNASPTTVSTGAITNAFLPIGIDLIKKGNNWIAHLVSYGNNKLIQLNFGTDILSSPILEATYALSGLNLPRNNRILLEGDTYYSVIGNESGGVQVIDFKDMNPSSTPVNLNLAGLPVAIGFDVIRTNGKEIFYSVAASGSTLTQVVFEATCGASINYSVNMQPQIEYTTSGIKRIELVALAATQKSSSIKTITISSLAAPVSTITTDGSVCSGSAIGFAASPDVNVQTFSWDFGDATNASGASTNHIYNAGDYVVELSVFGTNGCSNFNQTPINVFDPPTSAFSLPMVAVFCTNQLYTFVNQSVISPGSSPSFQWMVNGIDVSTAEDLTLPFTDVSSKDIALQVSIPGCSSTTTQSINSVQVGPIVNFSLPLINCQDTEVAFVNQTTGSISNYSWNFNDGNTSALENPTNTFLNAGSYDVTLEATNAAGCQNFVTKPVTIYSKPQTNFSIDLPPFSCAGSPSQFNDLTPPLTDSNVTNWSWGFGDNADGSSTQKNPTYNYSLAGDYQVSFSTTTNFGCSTSIQKQVTISTAPSVNFTNTIACLNQGTQFTDASDPTAKAWLWSMQNSTYTTKNPTHVFSTTGSQPVMLTVTGNNNCLSQITKTVNVPIPAVPDFTAISTCAEKPTVFQEKNSGGNDPAVSWNWDFAGQSGSGSPVEHIFPAVGSYTVKMNSTRQSGCVYSITKSVSISQSPHAQFTPSPDSGGSPLTVGFTNTSSLSTSYLWKFKDANNSTSTEFSPSFIFNQLGEYPVELIASNASGCQDSFTKMIQVVVPNVNAVLSEFKLTPLGGSMKATVTIKNEGNISMSSPEVIIDLAGNASVKEKLIGTILPGQSLTRTLSIDILSKNLQYACAELNTAGDTYLFDNRQCINLETETILIQPYPNPTQDELFIDWINAGSQSMHVVIYNAAGQIVLDKKYEPILTGLNQIEVNVSNLGAGIYFVTYFDGSLSRTSRFSIVR